MKGERGRSSVVTTLVIIGFRSFLLLRRGDFFSTEVIHMNFSFQLTFLFLDFVVS